MCLFCSVLFLSYFSEYSPDSLQSYNYASASSATGVIFKQIKLIMQKENVNSYYPPFFIDTLNENSLSPTDKSQRQNLRLDLKFKRKNYVVSTHVITETSRVE